MTRTITRKPDPRKLTPERRAALAAWYREDRRNAAAARAALAEATDERTAVDHTMIDGVIIEGEPGNAPHATIPTRANIPVCLRIPEDVRAALLRGDRREAWRLWATQRESDAADYGEMTDDAARGLASAAPTPRVQERGGGRKGMKWMRAREGSGCVYMCDNIILRPSGLVATKGWNIFHAPSGLGLCWSKTLADGKQMAETIRDRFGLDILDRAAARETTTEDDRKLREIRELVRTSSKLSRLK